MIERIQLSQDACHIQLHNMQLGTHRVLVDTDSVLNVDYHHVIRGVLSLHLTCHFQKTLQQLEQHLTKVGSRL